MKRKLIIMCTLMMLLNNIGAFAQKGYPKEIYIDELEVPVTYKGKAPKLGDFVDAFLNQDETSEVMASLYLAWNHYLRHEPLEPCTQFIFDERNGYLRYTYDAKMCGADDYLDLEAYYEMCYWNCADGKHKLIAESVIDMQEGKYYCGQYSGFSFHLYDNATHKLYTADDSLLGVYIDPNDKNLKYVTGEQMTLYDETVVVYRLPQQGKDITVEIYNGNKKAVVRLKWDGMRFKRLYGN